MMRSLSVLPSTARDLPITNGQVRPWLVDVAGVSGTVRQRGVNSRELRVYAAHGSSSVGFEDGAR